MLLRRCFILSLMVLSEIHMEPVGLVFASYSMFYFAMFRSIRKGPILTASFSVCLVSYNWTEPWLSFHHIYFTYLSWCVIVMFFLVLSQTYLFRTHSLQTQNGVGWSSSKWLRGSNVQWRRTFRIPYMISLPGRRKSSESGVTLVRLPSSFMWNQLFRWFPHARGRWTFSRTRC